MWSAIAFLDEGRWKLAAGALLTVPLALSTTSWTRWGSLQPPTARPRGDAEGFDLGPVFIAEPFLGVRIMRAPVAPDEWDDVVARLGSGAFEAPWAALQVAASSWSPPTLIPTETTNEDRALVAGTHRPVLAVIADLETPPAPLTQPAWEVQSPPHLPRGRDLAEVAKHRYLTNWPERLTGIAWLGHPDHAPVNRVAIGRVLGDAWIADVYPDFDTGELIISVAWDADRIDPVSCSLLLRVGEERPLLAQQVRITDLPSGDQRDDGPEPRMLAWNRRTIAVRLPRGPHRTSWSVSLMSPDGRLLDERPLVRRIESVELTWHAEAAAAPGSRSVIGERRPTPSAAESDEAVELANSLAAEARLAAARRRWSNRGELRDYLRSRLSYRSGELLIVDPQLLAGDTAPAVIEFLEELNRPIRALTAKLSADAQACSPARRLEFRRLEHGTNVLHDRIWIVGDTGLLVGGSPATFLPKPDGREGRLTTVSELPFGDVQAWRDQFDVWWQAGPPIRFATRPNPSHPSKP
ncbi:hypothetical protein [Capillimicrobium parvum]|uniref:Uncharacterized protein n=1 Tax=Capillimicrobium parvum TaxID=2884022 RepID=A0A9E6XXB2_9ACTN|nr:hypothetical protein [Capillimicrobium parvum]UGS36110.1 hypothetical protein DSM104329_02510 [Capillimicrobium parvum]